MTSAEWLADFP